MDFITKLYYYLGMNSLKETLNRILTIDLPKGQSAFLWGPRKAGKTSFLRQHFPQAIVYDLLKTDVYHRLLQAPQRLREDIMGLSVNYKEQTIILDEVQKIPALLDEVHWLIENTNHSFILCGSSARKLKRGGANLLGGRAWRFVLPPLVYPEIPNFNLLHAFKNGLLPSHYLMHDAKRTLDAYIIDYLKEEIQAEGLTRNLPAFAKFLDIAALCNTELINYSNIARDCGIDAKTVKEYYQILCDTYLGYLIEPYQQQVKRDLITKTPKFYFFDIGVVNRIARNNIDSLQGFAAGKSFEHWVLQEIMGYIFLKEKDEHVTFWRSKTGLEVDFVIENKLAVEVKLHNEPTPSSCKGLLAFCEEHNPKHALVICTSPAPRILSEKFNKIRVVPWQRFMELLWNGELF